MLRARSVSRSQVPPIETMLMRHATHAHKVLLPLPSGASAPPSRCSSPLPRTRTRSCRSSSSSSSSRSSTPRSPRRPSCSTAATSTARGTRSSRAASPLLSIPWHALACLRMPAVFCAAGARRPRWLGPSLTVVRPLPAQVRAGRAARAQRSVVRPLPHSGSSPPCAGTRRARRSCSTRSSATSSSSTSSST